MKDIFDNELMIGDSVAVVYHPEAYNFSLEKGTVSEIKGNFIYVELQEGGNCSYKKTVDDIVTRVVKITKTDTAEESDGAKDAIGQVLSIGDKVAFQRPIELGNTCKGFENGGIIARITAAYVFTEVNGEEKPRRKKLNAVIKVSEDTESEKHLQ